MFDPNLQREKAQEDIGVSTKGAEFHALIERKIIDLCREASRLRNLCFSTEDSYHKNIVEFTKLVTEFRMRLGLSEPFKFLHQNFGVYANAGAMQRHYADSVYIATCMFLTENISNAMAQSDQVQTSIHITGSGVLLDLDQGEKGFDPKFLDDVKNKSIEVYNLLTQGLSIQEVISQMRHSLKKTIGYVPQGLDKSDGIPYRGNGIANNLINDFFRTNFIPSASSNNTISVHSAKQLQYADRLKKGDRSVIHELFGPSEIPMDKHDLDDLFSGGFKYELA